MVLVVELERGAEVGVLVHVVRARSVLLPLVCPEVSVGALVRRPDNVHLRLKVLDGRLVEGHVPAEALRCRLPLGPQPVDGVVRGTRVLLEAHPVVVSGPRLCRGASHQAEGDCGKQGGAGHSDGCSFVLLWD